MSIFQESFRPYVDRQLKIREAILQHGNSNNRFNFPTNPVNKKNKIDQGAFFVNTVKRQCTIKMSSGVNINESSETAKQWVLRGGVFPETKGGKTQQGFVHNDQKNTAYGSPGTFSDADDGYGIVPMPGITDANIRTKSAYGSLREAQINFVCHNRRQLGILEKLYMRPGFPILVEWQWIPYVNNEGKIENTSYTHPSFWKKGITFNKLQNSILETKARTGGNYDAFIGLCKNFSFKATPAGGYECTTEIISTGEIIDGLKGKRDGFELEEESGTRTLDNFEYYLEAIKQYGGDDPLQNKNQKLLPVMQKLAEASPNDVDDDNFEGVVLYTADDLVEFIDQSNERKQERENNGVFDGSARDIVESILYSKVSTSGFHKGHTTTDQIKLEQWQKIKAKNNMAYRMEIDRIEEYLNHFIIRKGEFPSIESDLPTTSLGSPHTYVRWDFLSHIMNSYVLETYQEKQPITEINWGNLVKSNNKETFKYYDYVTTKGKSETIIPRSFGYKGKGEEFMPLSSILDISLDGNICILPHQINALMLGNTTATGANSSTPMADIQTFSKSCIAKLSHPIEATEHSIGMIFLNVDNLLKKYAKLRYTSDGTLNKKFNILTFLKQIWETDANSACAHTHNFMVHHDKDNTQTIRIIDAQSQSGLHPDDLYTFKIQDNKSVVRDFNFNSTIPSSLVATMAIVAQDPRSIGDIESVTCNSLNKGLSSRFSNYTVPDVSTSAIKEEREKKEQELADGAVKLFNYNYTMLTGHTWNGMLTVANVRDAINLYKKTQDSVEFLQCRYPLRNEKKEDFKINDKPKGGCIRPNINANKSAIIPLKFTCLLDGIGGILIGNVFKVDKSRLPIGYQNDDVAFIVHSESQTITAGQDWTTEIAGQLILLDLPQKTEEMEGVLISPGTVIKIQNPNANNVMPAGSGATGVTRLDTDEKKRISAEYTEILNAIAFVEANKGCKGNGEYDGVYNGCVDGIKVPKGKFNNIAGEGNPNGYQLTEMKIKDLVPFMNTLPYGGSATGRYQHMARFIEDRVLNYAGGGVYSPNNKFSEELQDNITKEMIDSAGYKKWKAGTTSTESFAYKLAGIWRGFPAGQPTDPDGTYPDKDANVNKAHVFWRSFNRMLNIAAQPLKESDRQ